MHLLEWITSVQVLLILKEWKEEIIDRAIPCAQVESVFAQPCAYLHDTIYSLVNQSLSRLQPKVNEEYQAKDGFWYTANTINALAAVSGKEEQNSHLNDAKYK